MDSGLGARDCMVDLLVLWWRHGFQSRLSKSIGIHDGDEESLGLNYDVGMLLRVPLLIPCKGSDSCVANPFS